LEERDVYIALWVRREPGLEFGDPGGSTLSVYTTECIECPDE